MARHESRWVDPAPLEVSRPRLPWWTLLPGWVKLVLSPIALLILLSWLGFQLGRVIYRYPLTFTVVVLTGVTSSYRGKAEDRPIGLLRCFAARR